MDELNRLRCLLLRFLCALDETAEGDLLWRFSNQECRLIDEFLKKELEYQETED